MEEKDIKRIYAELERIVTCHSMAVLEYVGPLARMLLDNPDKGIEMILGTYDKGLDKAYTNKEGKNMRSYAEAIAGGPFEVVPWAVYNAIGAVYPYLDREQKDKALAKIINILDRRNYEEVNGGRGAGHTTGIKEPLLLSDITIARWLYWPGLDEGRYLIGRYPSFFEFQKALIDERGFFRPKSMAHEVGDKNVGVNSDFLVAYALLRNDFLDWGKSYVKTTNPEFLERVMRGIVALRFGRLSIMTEQEIRQGENRLRELLPESLHRRITPLRQEKFWTDWEKYEHPSNLKDAKAEFEKRKAEQEHKP